MSKDNLDLEYIERLNKAFNYDTMANVGRRLGLPHATVRNYFREGRIPAPEVLIKIANETSVSINWLLMGTGDMYAVRRPPIGLGQFIEEKINEMIDQKLASFGIKADQETDRA
jgi:transcriptional regulator with XRE-family HTH domain